MEQLPTYYDIKYSNSSRIFEAEEIKGLTPEQIAEGEKFYDMLVEKLQKGEEISEGVFTGLLGAGIGSIVGPSIGRAICKALGIDENGTLGKLLTSRLVTAAIAYSLAK